MDPSMLKNMLQSYMDEKFKEFDIAIKNQDYQKLQQLAHKIKGNSGTLALGFNSLNDLGKEIETLTLENQDISIIKAKIDELKTEYHKSLG